MAWKENLFTWKKYKKETKSKYAK